jgi:predicted PurR-regulated permease PerM
VSSTAAVDDRPRPSAAIPPAAPWDLTRIVLGVVGIGGLIAASFWVLRPFLPAVVWATMIVVATWPALRAVQAWLWGKRGLAVAVMTLAMLTVLAVPLTVAVVAIVERADDVVDWSKTLVGRPLPGPPEWVVGLPLVGAKAGSLGVLLLQFLLTVAVSALLYARGERTGLGVLAFARRLAGDHGTRIVILSAGAIRAVALGIVVTALVQAVFGGIGLLITGVPHALLLSSIMVMLGIAQIGPAPVLLGAVIWLYADGQRFWGSVMLVWMLVTMSFDNILRPILIRKGADLPLVLVISGVLGGLLAFGLIGLFVGPVVLAVTYTLLMAWVRGPEAPPSERVPVTGS